MSHHKSCHTTNTHLQSSLDHGMGCTDRRMMHEITKHTTTLLLYTSHITQITRQLFYCSHITHHTNHTTTLLLHTHHTSHKTHHKSSTAHTSHITQNTPQLFYCTHITNHTTTLLLHTHHKSHRSHHNSPTTYIITSSPYIHHRILSLHTSSHLLMTTQHALTAGVVNDVCMPQPCIAGFPIFHTSHIIPHHTLQSTSQITVRT